ncbi:MAG TPA: M20/M25/M40 family metallo-hydrolase [Candidatus Dormibacteraeota bacterium]|nr:M20/M25/M40 family metallo-hydrolase [Candidatus Dormibacteraeota bacterium]
MHLFELTRALVDIESTTNHEKNVCDYLFARLSALTARGGGQVQRMPVEPNRDNLFVSWGEPIVTLSTHMDTVPPYFGSSEDEQFIFGRGACDAKGIIAAMISAAERLLATGTWNFGLLFVVGEERNSAGAKVAAAQPGGSRFLINGEPTENHLALGSKGALRYEITARGKLAHSAYPELGHSAIHTLLDVLQDLRGIPLPEDPLLRRSTLNIGTISGGLAPNVVADQAEAEVMFRTVGDPAALRKAVASAVAGRAEAREVLHTPAIRLNKFEGLPTTVVAFTTDIPTFNGAWGEPFLIGPGSIHVAHTTEERVAKKELCDAVEIYACMTAQLLATGRNAA